MQIRIFMTRCKAPEFRRFFGLMSCYLLLPILITACVTEPNVAALPEPTMVSLAPKSQVFSDQTLHSPRITQEMRNAQCHLHDEHSFRAAVLEQVNQLRAHEQVCGETKMTVSPPLAWNENLQLSAYEHAAQMAAWSLFSHTSLDGRDLSDRALAVGYNYAILGENIAAGQASVRTVIQAWLGSPSHCRQMLHPGYAELAVACVMKPNSIYRRYWVMNLGHQLTAKSP